MISPELRAEIRRLFFGEHWKVGTIASQLDVHHETVEHAINLETIVRNARSARARAGLVEPYKPFIDTTVAKYPKILATRVLEMIKGRGYEGSVFPIRNYLRGARPRSRTEAFLRLSTLPGEQAQVDWGSFGTIRIGSSVRSLCAFVMVLSYSRAVFARFVLDMTMESFLRCHRAAFESFGGVPRKLLYDNLKTAVIERVGNVVRFHPRLLDFAGHYHFEPLPCAVARGNEKGRVERSIRYLRGSFFEARTYRDLADLNVQLERWIEDISDARIVPRDERRRTVSEAFADERDRLLSLPAKPYEPTFIGGARSGKTPYVRFDCNDYSIPHVLVRKPLTIVADASRVRILDGMVEVARHERAWGKGQQVEDESHIAALAAEKSRAHELRGRDRLFAAAPKSRVFLERIATHGGHLGGTTQRLLRLAEQYGIRELDEAIGIAITNTSYSARSVAFILEQRRRAAESTVAVPVALPDDPRVRDLVIAPRPLSAFDVLARDVEEDPS